MPNQAKPESCPQHFYSLDVLRGLGAITVVINHWSNFYFYQKNELATSSLPFFSVLKLLYTNGWRAVDIFFCLSGFVFFWLYSEKISTTKVKAKEFFVLRFSRLYPLHFATLLLVAVGQYFMWRAYGAAFVSKHNTLSDFIQHLFFASAWFPNLKNMESFNGPVWSVSIEILLYTLFFLLCRLRWTTWPFVLVYVGISQFYFVHHGEFLLLVRGTLSFFLGGLAFRAYEITLRKGFSKKFLLALLLTTAAAWFLVPPEVEYHYTCSFYQPLLERFHRPVLDEISHCLPRVSAGGYTLFLFPLTIFALALWETRRGTLGKRFHFLGDISYSTYLLHFPLQIAFLLAVFVLGLPTTLFHSPLALLVFFAVLIPLSILSYQKFERPIQSFLRKKLLPDCKTKKTTA